VPLVRLHHDRAILRRYTALPRLLVYSDIRKGQREDRKHDKRQIKRQAEREEQKNAKEKNAASHSSPYQFMQRIVFIWQLRPLRLVAVN
jgi:hypothetical protein